MQHRKSLFFVAVLTAMLSSSSAFAGVWFELLHAPCWTGSENNIQQNDGVYGRYRGAIDCFNKDFNGGGARTVLTIKAFQPWELGTMFLYYDITGPFTPANAETLSPNEKGGFFGGITIAVSAKRVAEKITGKPFNLPGFLSDVSVKYEAEHVSKLGMLNYYGLQWDLNVPFMDFLTVTTVIRDDWAFEGVDFQVGAAWQKSFSVGGADFMFLGFIQVGIFGEGAGLGPYAGIKGQPFLTTQPELLWDFGKLFNFPAHLYAGFEWQFTQNRYLIPKKTENTLQGMIRWNL